MQNLAFAFHHYDVDNAGYITEAGLAEVFHREGKFLGPEQVHEIMNQADPEGKGKITFDEFTKLMKQLLENAH
jgi:Ca2+-binding EF-hand superfamily protein